jgi:tetratricopeptide (TPR) repeat protein
MPPPRQPDDRIPVLVLAGLLFLLTLAVFWPATRCGFLNFDDQAYVTENIHVQTGLTLANVKWAFSHPVSANWHPVTMLSHTLDCQLFGLKPWGHHLVNVLWHAVNAVLVFLWLRQLTGAMWRSLAVATLFAVHPLRVESVAWVAERKDVLSAFFGLLTLICYTRYVKKSEGGSQNSEADALVSFSFLCYLFYWFALIFYALGLMCKPMLVSLPFVLLLVDYWPLQRIQKLEFGIRNLKWLLVEKIPFFILAAVMSFVTMLMQSRSGVVKTAAVYPPGARFENLLVAYGRYLEKTFWPGNLAVYYPHPGYWRPGQVLLAGIFLCGISVWMVLKARRYPFLLMGWLWFLVTLIPVIGLVQVGRQSMADRYTYLPSLGILILTAWGVYELVHRWRYHQIILATTAVAVVAVSATLTRRQLTYWQDGETLFRHALAVTQNNYFAHKALGTALLSRNQTDEAIREFQAAIQLEPDDAEAHNNLGIALLNRGLTDAAAQEFQQAIRAKPDNAEAHYNLGNILLNEGWSGEAIQQFQEALRFQPENAGARNDLGVALASAGRRDEAVEQFREALRLKPEDTEIRTNLARALEWTNTPTEPRAH